MQKHSALSSLKKYWCDSDYLRDYTGILSLKLCLYSFKYVFTWQGLLFNVPVKQLNMIQEVQF